MNSLTFVFWGLGGWVPNLTKKVIFSEWVFLVGKMIPDLVGVFWDHLGVCTMDFWDPRGCAMIFPRVFLGVVPGVLRDQGLTALPIKVARMLTY